MKVLIVEDDEHKRRQIRGVLKEAFPQSEISEAVSLHGAMKLLDRERFSLVLLDMTMPTFDIGPEEMGGTPQAYGGVELVEHIARSDVHVPVIIVTQFDTFGVGNEVRTLPEVHRQLEKEHPDIYRGAVFYDTAASRWKAELVQLISAISGSD